ncbi:nucleotidyltransferase domain-containing protein [Paenibacillus sp. YPG26]|uniref:nucleotidyltransferase domain-containing protein n=1 Tax=Paenibacillus sp. YPG26 TaxID=2878915 RepID=UPI002041C04A|nr:nucleotidyltransferase domain-containing protein [Paenibacillus sp. YPG26]USB33388.1 nucleotidyltransferase domain-containing protein [Paenibacillus sp. YPG26]
MNNMFLQHVTNYLINKYKCHTLILYGSYVTGDFTEDSDLDVVGFTDKVSSPNDNHVLNNVQLDAWIYNTNEMNDPEKFLHIRDGYILLDERDSGKLLLERIDHVYNKGPVKTDLLEIEFLKKWLIKMQDRSLKGGIEGDFRYHWLLNDSLEIYFKIINKWYLGPKKSLQWLKTEDPKAYELFSRALNRSAKNKDVENLIKHITES